mmetsp:Transcript_26299/g.63472  ORF Transcript_26299/g.63472 Transcript_26299/m.63472 type:complete len:248 (-) Transcript_26299:198-941(-)
MTQRLPPLSAPSAINCSFASQTQQSILPAGKVHDVGGTGQGVRDLLGGLNPAHFHDALAVGLHGLDHELRGLRVSLRADDRGQLLLLLELDDELLALRLLLGDLLLLNRLSKLLAVVQVRNSHILNNHPELIAPLRDPVPDLLGHPLTHGQQRLRVVLRHDALEDLVTHRGQELGLVVHPQLLVQVPEALDVRAEEEADVDGDVLHVLGPGVGGDLVGPGADVVVRGPHHVRDLEVGALPVGLLHQP